MGGGISPCIQACKWGTASGGSLRGHTEHTVGQQGFQRGLSMSCDAVEREFEQTLRLPTTTPINYYVTFYKNSVFSPFIETKGKN